MPGTTVALRAKHWTRSQGTGLDPKHRTSDLSANPWNSRSLRQAPDWSRSSAYERVNHAAQERICPPECHDLHLHVDLHWIDRLSRADAARAILESGNSRD